MHDVLFMHEIYNTVIVSLCKTNIEYGIKLIGDLDLKIKIWTPDKVLELKHTVNYTVLLEYCESFNKINPY